MNLNITKLVVTLACVTSCIPANALVDEQLLIAMMQRIAKLEATVEKLLHMIEYDSSNISKQDMRVIVQVKRLIKQAKDKLQLGKADDAIGLVRIAIQDLYNTLDQNTKNSEAYITIAEEVSYCHYLLGKALRCKGDLKSLKLAVEALETAESLCSKMNKGVLLQYVRYTLGKVYKNICDLTEDDSIEKYDYLGKACAVWEKIPCHQGSGDDLKLNRIYKEVRMYLTQFNGIKQPQPANETTATDSSDADSAASKSSEGDSANATDGKAPEKDAQTPSAPKKSALFRYRRTSTTNGKQK